MSDEAAPVDHSAARWPWVVGFLVGVVFLTALPFLQKKFLKAPPAIAPLGAWKLETVDERAAFSSSALDGRVALYFLAAGSCDASCVEAHEAFGRGLNHTDDLGEAVHFVSLARETAADSLKGRAHGRWHVVSGTDAQLAPVLASLHRAWAQRGGGDAGSTLDEQIALQAFVLVDQQGQVRDFWRADEAGRGNSINAARLLARFGPTP